MLNADPAKEWPSANGIRVRVSRRTRLTDNVALLRQAHGLECKVCTALKVISSPGNTLPAHGYSGQNIQGPQHSQNGKSIRWVSASDPLLPVLDTVTVGVSGICGTVSEQTVLLEPSVGNNGRGILKF